jgi:hypothetical protein
MKYELEIADRRLKIKALCRGRHFEIQSLPLGIHKAEIINERRAMEISFQAWFQSDQAFSEFDIKYIFSLNAKYKNARSAIAEGNARDIDLVCQQLEIRMGRFPCIYHLNQKV